MYRKLQKFTPDFSQTLIFYVSLIPIAWLSLYCVMNILGGYRKVSDEKLTIIYFKNWYFWTLHDIH